MSVHPPVKQLLFDFHTMPGNPDVGRNFDFERIARYFKDCGIDSVLFPFRCNQGFAYFPTQTGTVYPSLKFDLLGKMIEICHSLGIRLTAYTNATVCVDACIRHPSWSLKTPDHSEHDNTVCSNSPFTDHICAMLEEVTRKYDVDGIFLDFGYDKPCICENCLKGLGAEGIDWKNEPEKHHEFAIRSSMKKYRRMCEASLKYRRDILLCINGIPFEEKARESTHFEFECIPTGRWGYHQLPVFSHYLRNIGGKAVTNMTGRFHGGWGDFGGLRPEASLEYDVLYGTANGMGTTIGDHFHPRGDLYEPVMNLVKKTFAKLRSLDEWTLGAKPETEIAVVAPKIVLDGLAGSRDAVTGAARMLCELKQQFDILSDELDWPHDYKLLILPDETAIAPRLAEKIRRHLDRGGKIISSLYSGLEAKKDGTPRLLCPPTGENSVHTENENAMIAPELIESRDLPRNANADGADFVFPEWGLHFEGESPWDPAFLSAHEKIPEFPDMPITCIRRGSLVELSPGTERIAEYIAPYFNRVSRKTYYFQYLPPNNPTGKAAMTASDRVIHISFPVFSSYFESGRLEYRTLVKWALGRMLPNPLIRCENTPSFVKVFLTAQPGRKMIHVLSSFPEKRTPRTEVIEDRIGIEGMEIRVRLDSLKPKAFYIAPERKPVEFKREDGYLTAVLPKFDGYTLAVLEE
ncbi:MAG: hypothetical protein BWY31_00906 [Lentisphaerae bacterium ADurb.Bin242]|nr:MAG: hypothetical protein BWY31_00906 [Lentisphaerae bacterium ADurb.Bin242]